MGYYSEVMISVTKKGYERIKKDQEKFDDYELLNLFEVKNFEKNNKSFVLLQTEDTIKYYPEFEDIKQLEKTLSNLKDGYVFVRLGEEYGDIEFRNNAKVKELLEPFDFIKKLYNLKSKCAKIQLYKDIPLSGG